MLSFPPLEDNPTLNRYANGSCLNSHLQYSSVLFIEVVSAPSRKRISPPFIFLPASSLLFPLSPTAPHPQPPTCLLRAASFLGVNPVVSPPKSVLRGRNVELCKNVSLSSLKCRPFKVATGQGSPVLVMIHLNSPHVSYRSSMDSHEKRF